MRLTQEVFRDSVATISKEGKEFYQSQKPKGRHIQMRSLDVFYLLVFFFRSLKYMMNPLMLFKCAGAQVHFIRDDLLAAGTFSFRYRHDPFIVFVILFTVIYGRIFCGWACPKPYLWRWYSVRLNIGSMGDSHPQKILRKMPWNGERSGRGRWFVLFFGLDLFHYCQFLLAYIIGMDKLLGYITHPGGNVGTLVSLLVFTCVFFFVLLVVSIAGLYRRLSVWKLQECC